MSRYAYIHTTTWQDRKFRQLSESAKMLYIAMLTAPNSNMIGLYEWPVAYALHDLGDWERDKFFSCLAEIEGLDMARYDAENEVVFIHNFLKHNPLTSIKQVVGGAKYFKALPRSPLFREFAKVWVEYVEAPFRKSLDGRTDDNAKRSLREIDRISNEIQELLCEMGHGNPMDTLSGGEIPPSDTPMDNPVPGHGQVPEPVTGHENGPEDDEEASAADGDVTGTESAEKPVSLGKVLKLWNDTLGPLGFFQVKKVTPARERAFRARLNAASERKAQEWWESVIGRLAVSNFMLDSARKKANWLTFDWLLSENNIVKVLEGKYDNDRVHVAPGNSSSAHSGQPVLRPLSYAEAMARFERRHGGGQYAGDVIDVEAREGDSGDAGTGPRSLPEAHGQGGHCHGPAERQGL